MHILAMLLMCFFVLGDIADGVYLTTCARMDTPILAKGARALCIASCSAQNCATGYCEKRGGRKTCVCSRCASGGNVPLDALLERGRRR
ncbi:unnamed protein product [Heligmosomoides polygyrus]|uniref:INVERT_DEFENSINS domain-containing protein n=1 Tax=Heligmosomoides polygyrus TaxID=6339 RepID=A0A183FQE0_HELPZ|nr:unnamed protein product [Heligmosomoides polygyrus]